MFWDLYQRPKKFPKHFFSFIQTSQIYVIVIKLHKKVNLTKFFQKKKKERKKERKNVTSYQFR